MVTGFVVLSGAQCSCVENPVKIVYGPAKTQLSSAFSALLLSLFSYKVHSSKFS